MQQTRQLFVQISLIYCCNLTPVSCVQVRLEKQQSKKRRTTELQATMQDAGRSAREGSRRRGHASGGTRAK